MNQLCVVICIGVAATVYASSVKQSDTSAKWEIFKKEFGKLFVDSAAYIHLFLKPYAHVSSPSTVTDNF